MPTLVVVLLLYAHSWCVFVCHHAINAVLHFLHHFHAGFLPRRALTSQGPHDTDAVCDTANPVSSHAGPGRLCSRCYDNLVWPVTLTLRLLIHIYMELLVKPEMLTSYIYGPTSGNAETVSFYLPHNVSTLNQCREVSCVTFVCKHFAS